jgi:hypothetical protein
VQTATELPSFRPAVCRARPAAERAAEAARPRRRDREAAEAAAVEAAAATLSSSRASDDDDASASKIAAVAAASAAAGASAKPARQAVVERPKTSPALSPSPGGQGRLSSLFAVPPPVVGRETSEAEGGEKFRVVSVVAVVPAPAFAPTSTGVFGRDCRE